MKQMEKGLNSLETTADHLMLEKASHSTHLLNHHPSHYCHGKERLSQCFSLKEIHIEKKEWQWY